MISTDDGTRVSDKTACEARWQRRRMERGITLRLRDGIRENEDGTQQVQRSKRNSAVMKTL